ncbi:unnamed protein product [Vicia faba]|uniref:Uncharacterized protein n=1 Tax=Vicia faba TaxID=3906 RepID=A0AAV1B8G5_VICFA|nr:unnamed protein product [Vicia faba]
MCYKEITKDVSLHMLIKNLTVTIIPIFLSLFKLSLLSASCCIGFQNAFMPKFAIFMYSSIFMPQVNRLVAFFKQSPAHTKKRSAHGVKNFHSQPALKLQTMKLKLSNKDITNFHWPRALWYPHDNKVAVKERGKLPTKRSMKIIMKSLGGEGCKPHVNAEETIFFVKEKLPKI